MGGSRKRSDGVQLNYETVGGFFSSPKTKAHGWANSIPVTPVSVHLSTFSNISSETNRPTKLKFYIETPKDATTKFCSNGPSLESKFQEVSKF